MRRLGPSAIHRRSFDARCYAELEDDAVERRGRSRRLGPEAERRVRRHYRLRGYRILAANARAGGYELDLVVRRGRTVVVCEVKARTRAGLRRPARGGRAGEGAPGAAGRARPGSALHPELAGLDVRFEAVAVRGRRIERVAVRLGPP